MSAVLPTPTQDEIDAGLEREIESIYRFAMSYAKSDPDLSREAFGIHARLVAKRSLQQIEKLERAKGLRK